MSDIALTHNEDTYVFVVKQKDYPEFKVHEADMQYIVDAFLHPYEVDERVSLYKTISVTAKARSHILERSVIGSSEVLMKLSHSAAKTWAAQVSLTYGAVIRSYAK